MREIENRASTLVLGAGDSRLQPSPFSGSPAYESIFWGTFGLWCVLETVGTLTKRSGDRSKSHDRGSSRLLVFLTWLALSVGFTLTYTVPQAAMMWKRSSVFFVGIGLMLARLAFRFYAMWVLGRFFTYDIMVLAGQTIVEAGPYRFIRHPSYTGALITLIGLGLALGNWAALLAILACMGTAYAYRITVEEAALVAVLGEPYKQYMRRTQRLVPFLF